MVSAENVHTSNIIWTGQVTFGNTYVYTYTYMHEIMGKEAMNLQEGKEGYMKKFGGRKGKGGNVLL